LKQSGSALTRRNVRWIATTRHNLENLVAERQFHPGLYKEFSATQICVPALRQRRDDIPLLVRYLVQKSARRLNKPIDIIPAEIIRDLQNRTWPGNVRELEVLIERSVLLTQGSILQLPV
jgi:formate hydrogenlyase transcriptional activator